MFFDKRSRKNLWEALQYAANRYQMFGVSLYHYGTLDAENQINAFVAFIGPVEQTVTCQTAKRFLQQYT